MLDLKPLSETQVYVPKPKKKAKRREYDEYETPIAVAEQGLLWLFETHPGIYHKNLRVLEPGCGKNHPFLTVVNKHLPAATLTGVELQHGSCGPAATVEHTGQFKLCRGTDFLPWPVFANPAEFDLIVTNPPYSLAEEFVRKTVTLLTDRGVAMFLLRLGFLASQKRLPLWTKDVRLRRLGVLTQRPSFIGGTDVKTDYGWFVFSRMNIAEFYTKPQMDWLPPIKKAA